MIEVVFYTTAAIAIAAAAAVLLVRHPMHAALYLIVSILALAVLFFILGAPLLAALQVILYAGAIMVLFLFLMMVMDLGPGRSTLAFFGRWRMPLLLSLILLGELAFLLLSAPAGVPHEVVTVGPKAVGRSLFGPYLLAVELAAVLLLAALVAVIYLSRSIRKRHGAEYDPR